MAETLTWPIGLPEADEVNQTLLEFRDYRHVIDSADFRQIKRCFDTVAPVQLHYVPTITPGTGVAPEHIRQQWLGLHLPVRSKATAEAFGEGFVVRSREALEILKVERPEAYTWWRNHFIGTRLAANEAALATYAERHDGEQWPNSYDPVPDNPDFPEYGANMNWFIFAPAEGRVIPVAAYRTSLLLNEPLLGAPEAPAGAD